MNPDWSKTYLGVEGFEHDLGVKFNGLGFYRNGSDTMIVQAEHGDLSSFPVAWKGEHVGSIMVHVFNNRDAAILANNLANMPTRLDTRD